MNSHRGEDIDIFAEDFVKTFINKFEPKNISYYSYGTPKVPEIGKILTQLYNEQNADM